MSTPDLDAIQRRLPYIPEDEMSQAERDRAHLFAYARDLEARIGRVEKLAVHLDEHSPHRWAADSIRAALTATDAS